MTNFEANLTSSLQNMTLQVNTKGYLLHAFIHRRYIGSNNGKSYMFEKSIQLKLRTNAISLLSAIVGLKNYDAFYDKVSNRN